MRECSSSSSCCKNWRIQSGGQVKQAVRWVRLLVHDDTFFDNLVVRPLDSYKFTCCLYFKWARALQEEAQFHVLGHPFRTSWISLWRLIRSIILPTIIQDLMPRIQAAWWPGPVTCRNWNVWRREPEVANVTIIVINSLRTIKSRWEMDCWWNLSPAIWVDKHMGLVNNALLY